MEQAIRNVVIVFVTVPDEQCAKQIARAVVQNGLAACAKIVPNLTSIYTWKNDLGEPVIEESSELQLIMKTTVETLPALEATILQLHPYEVPEFVAVRAEYVSTQYAVWVSTAVDDPVRHL